MKLTVANRIQLPILFPKFSDLVTLKLVSDIQAKIVFSQKEITELGLIVNGNDYTWNPEKAADIEVEFTDLEMKMLKDSVKELDAKKEIPRDAAIFFLELATFGQKSIEENK